MANKQVIFVTETDDKSLTDDVYIKTFLKSCYDLSSNDISYKFVHMSGKGRYKSQKTCSAINKLVKQNRQGANHVVYCFDTDKIDYRFEDKKFFDEAYAYCKQKKYDVVWFCYDIENVFIGETVNVSQKKSKSVSFSKKNIIFDIDMINRLSTNDNSKKTNGKSNIVLILDKYFNRNNN